MSKLPGAQEVMIDFSVSEEDVPTNAKIVSNQLRFVDNTSIDVAHNININIEFPKRIIPGTFAKGLAGAHFGKKDQIALKDKAVE
jgi:hypothetical protein